MASFGFGDAMADSEMIEEWADKVYESQGKETTWSICEVKCPEVGCPPVETILTDLSFKKPCPGNGVFKVFKPIKDVTEEDVIKALAADGASSAHGHGHIGDAGHGHEDGHAGHGDGSCCEHGADHGHSEHGHGGHS